MGKGQRAVKRGSGGASAALTAETLPECGQPRGRGTACGSAILRVRSERFSLSASG